MIILLTTTTKIINDIHNIKYKQKNGTILSYTHSYLAFFRVFFTLDQRHHFAH
jgi:hypothetical protein